VTSQPPDLEGLLDLWMRTDLFVRACGRTVDLDGVAVNEWPQPLRPLRSPLTLVTGWNPGGREASGRANRAANRALRASLERRGRIWRPALGRARDGSWAEPGFAIGGLSESEAADLGLAWGQLAVYVVTQREVIVLASDRSFRRARPRGAAAAG
jgi:hypothetical protein